MSSSSSALSMSMRQKPGVIVRSSLIRPGEGEAISLHRNASFSKRSEKVVVRHRKRPGGARHASGPFRRAAIGKRETEQPYYNSLPGVMFPRDYRQDGSRSRNYHYPDTPVRFPLSQPTAVGRRERCTPPTKPKPPISIAHAAGSGTPPTPMGVMRKATPPALSYG